MGRICHQCQASFEVTPDDLVFLDTVSPVFQGKKYSIPPPLLCPDCRHQRRFAYRNDRKLYHRTCNLTGKKIISIYSSDKPHIVFDQHEWWGDKWDPMDYGREFDFNRPFFEQWNDLFLEVPKISLWTSQNENSEYTHDSVNDKNCTMCFGVDNSRDCYYCFIQDGGTDCMDMYWNVHVELCYECFFCMNSYSCRFCQHCVNCAECDFCIDCIGCKNCFGCVGLRGNEQYYIFNEKHTKEEYERRLKELCYTRSSLPGIKERVREQWLKHPRRNLTMVNCENCLGDMLHNCKNVYMCFGIDGTENGRYLTVTHYVNNGMDSDIIAYGTSHFYECQTIIGAGTMIGFSFFAREGLSDCLYVTECANAHHLFGCCGLRHREYCVLNKQYTKEEYETLMPKIIEHMRKTSEWGEFFPVEFAPFGYNESQAYDYFPMSEEEVRAKGWKWYKEGSKSPPLPVNVPDDIDDVEDSICDQALSCEVLQVPFKIFPQELRFYRNMHLPIPTKCPEQRHRERIALRNPRKMWERTCAKCGKEMQTTYAPDRPEIIYCENCYLASSHSSVN